MTHPPATHRGDPPTAYQAEEHMNASGRRELHRERVLRAVETRPGLTAAHYGEITDLGHVATQRRLSDLENWGEVQKGSRVSYRGRGMCSWWPRERQMGLWS